MMTTGDVVTLVAAALAFFASLVAAGVAVYTARIGKFIGEQWWSVRANAYKDVIETLVGVHQVLSTFEVLLSPHVDLSKEQRMQEFLKLGPQLYEVRKVVLRGAFLMSPEAVGAIDAYRANLMTLLNAGDYEKASKSRDKELVAVLERVSEIARRDLNIA